MINASQIKEHMEVKSSDGKHIGTVFRVENGRLKLASGATTMPPTPMTCGHGLSSACLRARWRSRGGCRW